MSCALAERPPQDDADETDEEISWPHILELIRRRAVELPPEDADQLAIFAGVIEAFAASN